MPLKKKLDTGLIVKTALAWMTIAYIVCVLAFLVFPTRTFEILWKPMFHAFGMEPRIVFVLLGFVEALAYTWFGVWLFVELYNRFAKGER